MSDAIGAGEITRARAWAYQNTAPANVATLENAIEAFVYRPAVRRRLGLRAAVNLYAATGVVTNSLYARIGCSSVPRSMVCAAVLACSRLWSRVAPAAVHHLAPGKRADTVPPRSSDTPELHPEGGLHGAAT